MRIANGNLILESGQKMKVHIIRSTNRIIIRPAHMSIFPVEYMDECKPYATKVTLKEIEFDPSTTANIVI